MSCYFVVVWRRVLLLLLHEGDTDPTRPTLLPSFVVEDECCPQSEDKIPSPPCLSQLKRQGGGQSFFFLKSGCMQTCFTLTKIFPSIPPSTPPLAPLYISPSTPSVLPPQAPLLGKGGQARYQASSRACQRHVMPPCQRATANLFHPMAATLHRC